jgi:uncharacterized RDD family membrane protein YckC
MALWWYADKNKKAGPVQEHELRHLLETGRISLKTMVWQKGMATWRPLGEVELLSASEAVVAPPLPSRPDPEPSVLPLARRWPRFLARMFDIWLEGLLVAFLLGAILGRYSAGFVEWMSIPGGSQVFGLMCLPIALALDAVIYRILGNTPGKAFLGLKATRLDGKPLSLGEYLGRNFSMWISGLAFGLPLINLFTLASQSSRLGNGQQASYDEAAGFRVHSEPSSLLRKTVFGIAFAGLCVLMALLNSKQQAAEHEAIMDSALQSYSWENPTTKVGVRIDGKWNCSAQTNETGMTVYLFSEQANRALVVFAVEQAPGFTLHDYVRVFHKGTEANMRFADGGRFFQKDGHQAWQGCGTMVEDSTNRFNVEVIQLGAGFWRVVTMQAMPYEYSDALVGQLGTALWSTVR